MTPAEFQERLKAWRERMRELAQPVPDLTPAGGLPPKPWQDTDDEENDDGREP